MTSSGADLSTGYTGIAWADAAIRPRPTANADARSSFMSFSISSQFAAARRFRTNANQTAVYQFLKHWRPNGPECQPGGQLYIGRHPPYGPRCQPGPQPPATRMVSAEAAWSSGATGMARDAETAARLRQIANADAANIFIGFFLSSLHSPRCGSFTLTQKMWRAGNAAMPHQ
jgi:hypothetical protein